MSMNEDAQFYYLQELDDNPPNTFGKCEQCGADDVEIEYVNCLDLWRCVESFPCETVAEETEQAKEPVLMEMEPA